MTTGTNVAGLMGLTEDLMYSEEAMVGGAALISIFEGDHTEEEKHRALFHYAALLVSVSVSRTAELILGEEAMNALEAEAEELTKLGQGIS